LHPEEIPRKKVESPRLAIRVHILFIQGVSGGTVSILGVVVWRIPSKSIYINVRPIFNGCGDTVV
jgi:hypothetical protein